MESLRHHVPWWAWAFFVIYGVLVALAFAGVLAMTYLVVTTEVLS